MKRFEPYIIVNVNHANLGLGMDGKLEALAAKFEGEFSGASTSCTKIVSNHRSRDNSFRFYDLKLARKFHLAAMRLKNVHEVTSSSHLHEDDE